MKVTAIDSAVATTIAVTPTASEPVSGGTLHMAILAAWLGLFSDTPQGRNKLKAKRQGRRSRPHSRSQARRSVRRASLRAAQQNATATGEQQ